MPRPRAWLMSWLPPDRSVPDQLGDEGPAHPALMDRGPPDPCGPELPCPTEAEAYAHPGRERLNIPSH